MSLFFEKELNVLKSFGVEINQITAAEIAALVRACDRMENPFSAVNVDACGLPVEVSNGVVLWRLTVGATVWLDEFAKRWWLNKNRNKAYYWAVVYALIHARDKDAFVRLRDEHTAYERIKEEAAAISVTEDELNVAMDKIFNEVYSSNENKTAVYSQTDWRDVLLRLETQSGIPSEKWTWGYSADYVIRAYLDLSRFAKAHNGITSVPHMKDELDAATMAVARLRAQIIERVKATEQEKENAAQ